MNVCLGGGRSAVIKWFGWLPLSANGDLGGVGFVAFVPCGFESSGAKRLVIGIFWCAAVAAYGFFADHDSNQPF